MRTLATPVCAGQLLCPDAQLVAGQPILSIKDRPLVGQTWLLGGFSLTLNGPPATTTEDPRIQLLLGGEVIDAFTIADFPAASFLDSTKFPQTAYHDYSPGFVIYDTTTLSLRRAFNFSFALPQSQNWRYVGNVRYAAGFDGGAAGGGHFTGTSGGGTGGLFPGGGLFLPRQ